MVFRPRNPSGDALAAIAEFFRSGPEGSERARAILAAESSAALRESATAAAWLAANCLRSLETDAPGYGSRLLQGFGLTVAPDQ